MSKTTKVKAPPHSRHKTEDVKRLIVAGPVSRDTAYSEVSCPIRQASKYLMSKRKFQRRSGDEQHRECQRKRCITMRRKTKLLLFPISTCFVNHCLPALPIFHSAVCIIHVVSRSNLTFITLRPLCRITATSGPMIRTACARVATAATFDSDGSTRRSMLSNPGSVNCHSATAMSAQRNLAGVLPASCDDGMLW